MDVLNDLALKSAGREKEGMSAQHFLQAVLEMQEEATFYLLMLGEENKSA